MKAMRHNLLRLLVLVMCVVTLPMCATPGKEEATPRPAAPEIYANMPLKEALEAAVDFGGETLQKVKKLVRRRGEENKAAVLTETALIEGVESYEPHQLINAGHLYATFSPALSEKAFTTLVHSGRAPARALAWHLATLKPSAQVAGFLDRELTRAVMDNDEDAVLLPQMANAVRENRINGVYTLVRRGLMQKGDEEFAQAMAAMDPAQASKDFLAYLALAPAEELRQLTLSSVNLYSCLLIFRHLRKHQPDVANAQLDRIFFYSVSRNNALADLAQEVLESMMPQHTEHLAFLLSRHPVWVQMAYLESARRRMNPKTGLLLTELKKVAAESDVVQEIGEIRF